ncbi:MAG: hypothetical protein NC238_10415 [Dehalobacter sp.]|nr:hypothetical protein [Dehalobacter sp.]
MSEKVKEKNVIKVASSVPTIIQIQYLKIDEPLKRTTSFIVGNMEVPAPCFTPEVKGDEDVDVLLRYSRALNEHAPIIMPANRWSSIVTDKRFLISDILKNKISILELIAEHPILFMEPPEFFRYRLTKKFVTYALKGDRQKARKFNNILKSAVINDEEKVTSALSIIPEFYRPFIARQLESICQDSKIIPPKKLGKQDDISAGWLDESIDYSYPAHMSEIIADIAGVPNAAIIPTVPPILKSSENSIRDRVLSANRATSLLCKHMTAGRKVPIRAYFHLYIDSDVLNDTERRNMALVILERGLDQGGYCGVALTITDYEDKDMLHKIESFVNEVANRCNEHMLPLILPRSGWYGLYLTDYGVQSFSCLLNGKREYVRGGGKVDEEYKYGLTPIIDRCRELRYNDAVAYANKNGGFQKIKYLPSTIDRAYLGDFNAYRMNVGKPCRLIHAEEARRIRQGKLKGDINPAKRYFARSEHQVLGNKGL